MKVVLLKNVDKLGKVGEIKSVASGFASNFLIPNKLVKPATESAMREAEKQVKIQESKEKKLREDLRKLAAKIEGKQFRIEQKSKNGKLFGSVKVKKVLKLINEKGFELAEKNIVFAKPIKDIGEFEVTIVIGDEFKAKVKLIVEEKQ